MGRHIFYFEPDPAAPHDRRMPFATIVQSDYEGFDVLSDLARPGVFRVNIGVGRERFEELIGYAPAAHERRREESDYAELDRLLPHPAYASQGSVAILNPGPRTGEVTRELLAEAHNRARRSDERTRTRGR